MLTVEPTTFRRNQKMAAIAAQRAVVAQFKGKSQDASHAASMVSALVWVEQERKNRALTNCAMSDMVAAYLVYTFAWDTSPAVLADRVVGNVKNERGTTHFVITMPDVRDVKGFTLSFGITHEGITYDIWVKRTR